ncbi:MAG TPA: ribosome biogenesis factor YjgA [Burkholderiales bacterium]
MQQDVISKTQRKNEMLELQALGAALVELSDSQLAQFTLEPRLREAVDEAKRIKSHGARKRQIQYIGRLMRDLDAEPIRAGLAAIEGGSAQATARHRRHEAWRERLLADDEALTQFAAEHPGTDLQALRALIRNARKEAKEQKPPRAYRELFRFVKQCSDSNPS